MRHQRAGGAEDTQAGETAVFDPRVRLHVLYHLVHVVGGGSARGGYSLVREGREGGRGRGGEGGAYSHVGKGQ